ncbi:hypothetical protein JCM30204_17040 [Dysgonomonas termitidis]
MQSKGYKYSGGNLADDVAWYDGNSNDITHPAGTKKANELGIYDMSGNVWEWCNDIYGNYKKSDSQTNPEGASSGYDRVIRGGGWQYNLRDMRVPNRYANAPGDRYGNLGFRLACSD